jgi:hypothetical protein
MMDRNVQVTGRVGDPSGTAGWNEANGGVPIMEGGGGWTGSPPMSTRFHNSHHPPFSILAPMMPSVTKL